MGFDRRREKSFGEPTRVRADGTSGSAREVGGDDVPKRPANTAYERYKQELHAFFNGEKPLPEHLKDMLATRPGAAEHGLQDAEAEAAASAGAATTSTTSTTTTTTTTRKQNGAKVEPSANGKTARRVINGPTDEVLAIVL